MVTTLEKTATPPPSPLPELDSRMGILTLFSELGGISTDRVAALSPHVSEVEARFFGRHEVVAGVIERSRDSIQMIHQSYFPPALLSMTQLVVRSIAGPNHEVSEALERFSKSRLRRAVGIDRNETYSLDLKGPKGETVPEQVIPIGVDSYSMFRSHATDYLLKFRNSIAGEFYLRHEESEISVPVTVDIDRVVTCGRDIKDVPEGRHRIALRVPIVEVEIVAETRKRFADLYPELVLNRSTIVDAVNRGAHNLPFLNSVTSLHGHPLESMLSSRRMAKDGIQTIDRKIKRILNEKTR